MIQDPLYGQTTAVLEPDKILDIGDCILLHFGEALRTQIHYKGNLGYNTQFSQERMA